jgi:pimeloyl-ACP methyl ester carboxylesterase
MIKSIFATLLAAAIALAAGPALSQQQAQAPRHFILVHGAWHTGDAWDGVIKGLQQRGFTAEAITLPGYGPGNGDPGTATLEDCAAALAAVLQRQQAPVVVVAHSAGGVAVQQAVPRAPTKVAQVVFFDAFLADDGKRLLDSLPPDIKAQYEKTAAAHGNTLPVPPDLVRTVLMPGDPPAQQDAVIARLVVQPYGYYAGTVDAARFAKLPVRRAFLFARDDRSLPPGAFRGMVAALGPFDETDIPGGHEVMFTDPDAVAGGLAQLAGKVAG